MHQSPQIVNAAAILAGGCGTRFGAGCPKQFLRLGGITVLEHSIRTFCAHEFIDSVCVVVAPEYVERVRQMIAAGGYDKVHHVVAGGNERWSSSVAAIQAYESENAHRQPLNILLHDAARPLVSADIISRCVHALAYHRAVDVAVPASDTIVEVDAEGYITSMPNRATLRCSQTPQCFRYADIAEAYRHALADDTFAATDDCGVLHRYLPHIPIFTVDGAPTNLKITYPTDLSLAEQLLLINYL